MTGEEFWIHMIDRILMLLKLHSARFCLFSQIFMQVWHLNNAFH